MEALKATKESKDLIKSDNPLLGKLFVAVCRARLEKDYECVGAMTPEVTVS